MCRRLGSSPGRPVSWEVDCPGVKELQTLIFIGENRLFPRLK